jgi:hypothetical protein
MAETTRFSEPVEGDLHGRARDGYQPPRLTPIGNARDLLAGCNGSIADVPPAPFPKQPSGGC